MWFCCLEEGLSKIYVLKTVNKTSSLVNCKLGLINKFQTLTGQFSHPCVQYGLLLKVMAAANKENLKQASGLFPNQKIIFTI